MKKTAQEIWQEYEYALQYNDTIGLESRVEKNENFFLGKQWEGVNAPDLDKPVFNILKRVVNYFIAMLVSDNIGVGLSLFNRKSDGVNRVILTAVEEQVRQVMEYNGFHSAMRGILRDAAVDGDGVLHVFFNADAKTGRAGEKGLIEIESIDNTDIFFGNPQLAGVQRQPYILIESRRSVEDVKEEMRRNRAPKAEIEKIQSDCPRNDALASEYTYGDKVSVLTKYWREGNHIRFCKVTRNAVVQKETDSGLERYPICYMSWERVKNCYHGMGVIDGLIPNQMAINKMAALAQRFIRQQAFPRIFFNKNKLDKWVEGVKPLAVQGNPSDIIYADTHAVNMSGQVGEYIDRFIGNTKELMGASDAALGNVNPENTSAIIAVQKATAMPLELVKQAYYQFVEDFVRICIDQMRAYYGKRTVLTTSEAGEQEEIPLDFSMLGDMVLSLNVDIGASAYWSEMSNIQTLDNLYEKGLLEPVTYLESIPAHLVPNKAKIESDARRRMEMQEAAGGEEVKEDAMPQMQTMRNAGDGTKDAADGGR